MSIFDGKLRPRGGFGGKLKSRTPPLRVVITPVDDAPRAEITQKGFAGVVARAGKFFRGVAHRLAILYRFLASRVRIIATHSAKAGTAPAVTMKADSAVTAQVETPLTAQPATEAAVDSQLRASVLVNLMVRKVAAAVYIKNLPIAVAAALASVPGAVAKYREAVKMTRTAEAEATSAAILESRYNIFIAESMAAGSSAPSESVASKTAFTAKSTAASNAAAVAAVSVQSGVHMTAKAAAAIAWTVEFRTHAGELLYSLLVNNRMDCPDPVAGGEIDAPTRESDAQWNYLSFIGWSRTPNGEADETALQNVTAPLVLYPAFEKELRYYDISFYDGETLLTTLSVAYGETPSYTPTKSGYTFVGWTPEPAPVTGPAVYGAIWISEYLASGTCGETATWGLTKAGDLIISGTGAMYDYTAASEQPWYAYASAIDTVTVEDGITHIGSQSFRATNTTAVTISDSVTSIGKSAFYGNTLLTDIRIPASVSTMDIYVLCECTALTNVELPEGLPVLGGYMFYKCTALTGITIPASVTVLPDSVLRACTSLASVTILGQVTKVGNYAFADDKALTSITLPDSVTDMGAYTFYNCTGLKRFTIPAGVTSIGNYTFYNCTSLVAINQTADYLTGVIIPETITTVGDGAFRNCTAITYVSCSAKTVRPYAFQGCSKLTQARLYGVTVIGYYVFYQTGLTSLYMDNAYSNWYRYTSETSTSGTRTSLGGYTNSGLANTLKSNGYACYAAYWLKIV